MRTRQVASSHRLAPAVAHNFRAVPRALRSSVNAVTASPAAKSQQFRAPDASESGSQHQHRQQRELQQKQYRVLESISVHPPYARISTDTPSGCRGLVATRDLNPADVVLAVPSTYALSVPRQHALGDIQARVLNEWHQWLQHFEEVHGKLPMELVSFLADVSVAADVRIAAWLLYLKQQQQQQQREQQWKQQRHHNPDHFSYSSDNGFWSSYLDLLPELSEYTAVDTGLWTEPELQYLEPAIMRSLLACYNSQGQAAAEAAHQLMTSPHRPVSALGLAPNRSDVLWALSAAKTRPYHNHQQHCTALYPLIDIINHAAASQANCKRDTTLDGYVVKALRSIKAGEEITMSYTDNNMLSNIDIMANWGFVISPNPGDMLPSVPCYFGTMTHIDWAVAVQAAATLVLQQQQQRLDASSSSSSSVGDLKTRLAAAAANLPLLLSPDSTAASSSSSSDWQPDYLAAAEALQLQLAQIAATDLNLQQQQQWQQQQQQQQLDLSPSDLYQPHPQFEEHGNSINERFSVDLEAAVLLLQQNERQQQQQQVPGNQVPVSADVTAALLTQQQQQVQLRTSLALRNSCQALVASCTTTAEEDAVLLSQLHQLYQQQQQQQQHGTVAHAAGRQSVQNNSHSANAGSLQQQQQQQWQRQQRWLHKEFEKVQIHLVYLLAVYRAYNILQSPGTYYFEEAVTVMTMLTQFLQQCSSSSSSSSSSSTRRRQQGRNSGGRSDQALIQLLPDWHWDLVSSNSSGSSSRMRHWKDREAMRAAASKWFDHLTAAVPGILARQDQLVQGLLDLRQDLVPQAAADLAAKITGTGSSSSSSSSSSGKGGGEGAVGTSRYRLAAALAARLEQKRLLAVAADLCGGIAQQLER